MPLTKFAPYARAEFLKVAKDIFRGRSALLVCGLPAQEMLLGDPWPTPEAYLEGMAGPVEGSRQWGGHAEATLMAFQLRIKIFIFTRVSESSMSLTDHPVGPENGLPVCILWTGTHFDVIRLTEHQIEAAMQERSAQAPGSAAVMHVAE